VNDSMELLKRLLVEEDGQGLVEYTLIVVLVALVFWVAIKNTNIGNQLASGWSRVTACVGTPTSCDSAS
jgi:Flp pilus assembly pilin Flp